jgi:predicted AAA+ superfamily ATPase
MIARWMEKEVENKLHYRRIVYLHGARQTGKTTLVRNIKANRGKDVSLDDQSLRESAILDPLGFLVHKAGTTMVIDEVQKAPLLIEAMKLVVDRNTEKGQFLITGSSDVFSMPEVKENLAGRISTLILRPFAVGEIMGVKPTFLLNAFEGEFPSSPPVALKPDVLQLALKGGYPEAYGLPEKERKLWHLDYINSLLLKDARDDYGIMKSDQLRLLVQRLATWS